MMRHALVLAGVSFATVAFARSGDGKLGAILVPNNGQPAIVVRGESFTVRAERELDILAASGGTQYDLPEEWRRASGGRFEATVRVPPEFSPGFYELVGDDNGEEDVQERALLVLDAAPKQYDLAHIASPRFHNGLEASLAGAFDRNPPLAVLVTGSLTDAGTADDYRSLIDWLDTCPVPTIVAPGERDSAQDLLGDYFDSAPFTTWCGADTILAIGASAAQRNDADLGVAGAYQTIRRATKPARWSIGLTGYSHGALNMRVQMILFVDTPLTALVAGRVARDDTPAHVAWDSFQGATRIMSPAKDAAPGIHWIRVTPAGVSEILPADEDQP